ncbi:hypothetical protein [Streptomyces sp. NPDC046887]|uniref:hypothetical protein n=1 Tax=Streptomyces sp. NPDC046887 TaxID=3155472 RepID=UPI0033E15659
MTEQRGSSTAIPEKFGGLVAEFRGLVEKYPDAVRHFSLAYYPAGRGEESEGALTVGFVQPVFECSEIEPGLAVCERVDEQ